MKDNIKRIIKGIIVFAFYFGFSYIVEFALDIFNIDVAKWKYVYKIIFIYALDLTPFIFLILVYLKDLKKEFKVFKNNIMDYADKYVRIWLLGIILMSLSNLVINLFTNIDVSNNEKVVREIADILPIYSVLSVCLFAPIVEELAYRKTLKNIFVNKWVSIIISGIIFGLAHVIGTYESLIDILYVIPYGIMGSIFMYIYADSDNIWSTISLHFIHNTILLVTYFISNIF